MGQVIRGGEQFETHIEADHRGQLVQQGPDSGALDAFGRQRFSQPFTLFDSIPNFVRFQEGIMQTCKHFSKPTEVCV